MSSILRLAIVTGLLVLSGCSSVVGSFPTETAPTTAVNPAEGYLLEPGNRVRVTVFGEDSLSGDFTIDAVGSIALPLAGNVRASGITVDTLAGRIEDMLKRRGYMQVPDVSVEVQTFRPFYVLGEVREPGEFPYTTGLTVLGAIARAGGYDYRAYEGQAVLVRTLEGKQQQYLATEFTPLMPGDIVKVLERRF